jgi:hypothetical protein
MKKMFYWILEIISGYLLADFLVGLFHWLKDSYFTPHTFLIGHSIIWPSRLHHLRPRYVTEFSDWDLFKSSGSWTLLWMGFWFYYWGFSPFNLTLFIWIAINDIVHKYTHVLDSSPLGLRATEGKALLASERPTIITKLQNMHMIQTHDQHHMHHIQPHCCNYCPITPYVNIVLEKINFWRTLESIVLNTTGYKPRDSEDKYIEDDSYPAGIKFIL